ncbi:MAG: adenylate/guanylate cyclase domain-containing protein [Nanoarchaeota archaeon]|nr:adenylate/guanylate cyclase domain-containing protein [Nanoarchaeota archaeon]
MEKIRYFFILMFILMSSFVLADISLSESEEIYNLGDKIYINADGLRGAEIGNLNINLVCGNKTVNLVRWPASDFSKDEDHSYSMSKWLVSKDLEISNLTEILGGCQIIFSLGDQTASTKVFTISNDVFVSASVDKTSYNPDEGILVKIDAIKANGDLLDGFVEVTNATSFSKAVEDGFVSESFLMPETTEAGIYSLGIRVYDVGLDGVLNEGFATTSFSINQVASSMIMSLSDVEAIPGENFTVGAEVFDQSGKEILGTVSVKIISPENEEIEVLISTGDFSTFEFPINATAGPWKVIAMFDGIGEEREFEMIKSSRMEFNINESVLEITCVGNWECNESVSVQIDEENSELNLKMDVGEIRKFSLKAPQGEHEVIVSDGKSSINRQVLLNGNAISVKDFEEGGIFKAYSFIWIFLIIVLGVTGIALFMNSKKTKTLKDSKASKMINVDDNKGIGSVKSPVVSKVPFNMMSHISSSLNLTNRSPKVQSTQNYNNKDKKIVDLTKSDIGIAESSLVLKGEKYPSVVVALSIKNYATLGSSARDTLIKAMGAVNELKGVVDWRDDHAFIIFSPLVTKTYKNEVLASKAGFKILRSLKDHNKKFKDKIEFNLGVNVGELIASKVGSKLKYTGIGNTVSLAKRIADSDLGKLLVSESVRKKMLRELKVIKGKEIGKNQIYEVSEIVDREANTAKLKNLLKRMD